MHCDKEKMYIQVKSFRYIIAYVLVFLLLWYGGPKQLKNVQAYNGVLLFQGETDMEMCEGLGSLEDIGEQPWGFFWLRPDAEDFGTIYYEQLDEVSKSFYDNFYEQYKNGPDLVSKCTTVVDMDFSSVKISWNGDKLSITDEEVPAWCRECIVPAMLALIYDHPEMSWLVNARYGFIYHFSANVSNDKPSAIDIKVTEVSIQFKEATVGTKEEMDLAIEKVQRLVEMEEADTDYKKLKVFHDYLADTIVYNDCVAYSNGTVNNVRKTYTNSERNAYQTAYSAFYPCNGDEKDFQLNSNYTVCAGYAKGFKVLCDAYGIPCIYVTGTGNTSAHGWDYVRLNENWYAVDCTWDDRKTGIIYTYFLVGSESRGLYSTFGEEHTASGVWMDEYPNCVFSYPPLAVTGYCEHEDKNEDNMCDVCNRILLVGLTVTQADWNYGEEQIPMPIVTVDNDSDAVENCIFLYKKKDASDSEYVSDIPIEVGEYTLQITLPHKCDETYDYPTVKETVNFSIVCMHPECRSVVLYPADCLEKGKEKLVCEICGTQTDTKDIEPTGHTFAWVIDELATLESAGRRHEECKKCHMTRNEEVIPKLELESVEETLSKPSTPTKPLEETPEQDKENPVVKPETGTGQKPETETSLPQTAVEKGRQIRDEKTGAAFVIVDSGEMINGKSVGVKVQYRKPEGNASRVTIPDTVVIEGTVCEVTDIAKSAFKNQKKLTAVTIGKNIAKIPDNAFYGCKNLKKITIQSAKVSKIGKNAFKGIAKKAVIKVPKKQLAKYKKLLNKKTGYKKTMKIKK